MANILRAYGDERARNPRSGAREAQTVRVDNIAYIDFDEGVYCHVDADMAYQEGS